MKARIWITAAVLLVLLSAMLNLFSACRSDEEEEGDVTTTSALPDEKLAAREKDNAFAYDVYQTYVEITSYHGQSAIVSVPATHGGLPVASVGQSAFMNNTVISRVSLPESVVNIAAMAFMGCSSLQNVTMPGIRAVGVSAFRGSGLTEVELPVICVVDGETVEADPAKAAATKVVATVIEQFKGEKVLVFKFKKRKNYKKLRGHRQQLTRVEIKSVGTAVAE